MTNFAKYLTIIEELNLSIAYANANEMDKHVGENVMILNKYIKSDVQVLAKENADLLNADARIYPNALILDKKEIYCVYLQNVMLHLVNDINFDDDTKENLISVRHFDRCVAMLSELAYFTLYHELHPIIKEHRVFGAMLNQPAPNYDRLHLSIALFKRIFEIKKFRFCNLDDNISRDYIAAIFTLFTGHSLKEHSLSDEAMKKYTEELNFLFFNCPTSNFFRNILFLKGLKGLPSDIKMRLHKELTTKLSSKYGFAQLALALIKAPNSQGSDNGRGLDVLANIIAWKGHSLEFQEVMIRRIFTFLADYVKRPDGMHLMGAVALTLRRLYDLNVDNKSHIIEHLKSMMQPIVEPEDMLCGLIIMERDEVCMLILKLYHLFYVSFVECLPSELLIPYIRVLLQMYTGLNSWPSSDQQQMQISNLIVRCLSNMTPTRLHAIIGQIYKQTYDRTWFQIHQRMRFTVDHLGATTVKMISDEMASDEPNLRIGLNNALLSTKHNILIFDIFLSLLHHLDDEWNDNDEMPLLPSSDTTTLDPQSILRAIDPKYPMKIDILISLNAMISSQGLQWQITENSDRVLTILLQMLERNGNFEETAPSSNEHEHESFYNNLVILLTLTQEILAYTKMSANYRSFIPKLKKMQDKVAYPVAKEHIQCVIALMEGGGSTANPSTSLPFGKARFFVESDEIHSKVYGMQMLSQLLDERDAVTMSNTNIIKALTLRCLSNDDSYVFLNCVRLCVALFKAVGADILETLSDEYLNESAKVDYRLVIGEAILKICKELGPLSYNYKSILIKCFMIGARSPMNEFRWSSYSNLAQLCRTLSYQVHHFLYELISLIENELSTGKHIPAKRAAIQVISELLEGMDNLMNYEEMLLPLYQLLKVVNDDQRYDEVIRTHAANGLKALAEKCRKFFQPPDELQVNMKFLNLREEF